MRDDSQPGWITIGSGTRSASRSPSATWLSGKFTSVRPLNSLMPPVRSSMTSPISIGPVPSPSGRLKLNTNTESYSPVVQGGAPPSWQLTSLTV